MAAQVLSHQVASDVLYASGGVLTGGDISTVGGDVKSNAAGRFQRVIVQDDSLGGENSGLDIINWAPTPTTAQRYSFYSPSSLDAGNGVLLFQTFYNNVPQQLLIDCGVSPSGNAGPPVVTGAQAILGLASSAQSGVAQMPTTAAVIQVANTAVKAGTIVMVTQTLDDTTVVKPLWVTLQVGVGFTINSTAAPTVALPINWFIVHY